ncbi:serine/threonine protein kinase, partial [Micromonospora sp. STR1_7]|nr:serine/threonine protein kinase [Micromonospora parastrephiae]
RRGALMGAAATVLVAVTGLIAALGATENADAPAVKLPTTSPTAAPTGQVDVPAANDQVTEDPARPNRPNTPETSPSASVSATRSTQPTQTTAPPTATATATATTAPTTGSPTSEPTTRPPADPTPTTPPATDPEGPTND